MAAGPRFLSEVVDSFTDMGMGAVERFGDGDFDDNVVRVGAVDGSVDGFFGDPCFGTFGEAPGPSMPDDVETVALLAGLEPGPAAMMILGGVDSSGLDPAGRAEVAAGWQRQLAWVNARAQFALADSLLAIDPQSVSAEAVGEQGWRIELVAATLGWSPISTANRLATAQRLVIELPHMVGCWLVVR